MSDPMLSKALKLLLVGLVMLSGDTSLLAKTIATQIRSVVSENEMNDPGDNEQPTDDDGSDEPTEPNEKQSPLTVVPQEDDPEEESCQQHEFLGESNPTSVFESPHGLIVNNVFLDSLSKFTPLRV